MNLIPRSTIWPGEVPRNSTGSLRPRLAAHRPYLTVHYTGANTLFLDRGDAITEIRSIHNWATNVRVPPTPWEYNWPIHADGEVIEYAGMFRAAHSAGENDLSHGVLLMLGVGEAPTQAMIDAFRELRHKLVTEGELAPDHEVRQHNQMPDAETSCPGTEVIARWPRFLEPWEDEEMAVTKEEFDAAIATVNANVDALEAKVVARVTEAIRVTREGRVEQRAQFRRMLIEAQKKPNKANFDALGKALEDIF